MAIFSMASKNAKISSFERQQVSPGMVLPAASSIGLALSSELSSAFVNLHLETRRRHYPYMPLRVHENSQAGVLQELCDSFGPNIMVVDSGLNVLDELRSDLRWAKRLGLDMLVCMSPRFVPVIDWVPALQALAWRSQYATYSNRSGEDLGFRAECIAFHVNSWFSYGGTDYLTEVELSNDCSIELLVHNAARIVHRNNCIHNRELEEFQPKKQDFAAYGDWDLMGTNRFIKLPQVLWHQSCDPIDYTRAAWLYGMTQYDVHDFI